MFPYKTSLQLNRGGKPPLYIQIANELVRLIRNGILASGTKLPGSRSMAQVLEVHRKTVVAAYDELLLQGWITSKPRMGVFVHKTLPLSKTIPLAKEIQQNVGNIGFSLKANEMLNRPDPERDTEFIYINDGVPDARLTPIIEIAREYRSLATHSTIGEQLGYGSTHGNLELRKALVDYLNQTRGLHIKIDQILITRGSQMGVYLASQVLLGKNDFVIVGNTNYIAADLTFIHTGAKILRVPVDDDGMDTTYIEKLCSTHKIRSVYVTPHHHHPTTVTLSASRRLHLLCLAQTYHFAIIEDDYDYDFNYDHAPILPLASYDNNGNVIYIGSVCKTVAPVYRVGYLVAPQKVVEQCAQLRRIIDRQGDALLEMAFAQLIKSGAFDSHIRKVLKVYKSRRNLFCQLLQNQLGEHIHFEIPKGGMAVWACLDKRYSWDEVALEAQKVGLIIGDWKRYDTAKTGHNGIRLGFAAYNEMEMEQCIQRLATAMKKAQPED